MKGYGISMPPVNAGIASDMEMLLEAFKAKQSVRLIKFHEVAIDYELSSIYAGRLSLAELLEFEECLLKAAFAYTSPTRGCKSGTPTPRTLTERVFGVYATFVLYYSQPLDYVSKILVTPSDLMEIRRFCEEVLLPGRHLDTFGCIYKLYADDAFSIVAYVNSFDPICHRRYDLPNPDDDVVDEDEKHTPLAETAALMEDPILKVREEFEELKKTMAHVQEEMEKKQQEIEGCPKVAETTDNFLTRMKKIYASLKNEIAKVNSGEIDDLYEQPTTSTTGADNEPVTNSELHETSDSGPSRLSIKDKAYGSKIMYARNRRYADPNMNENFADLPHEKEKEQEEPTQDLAKPQAAKSSPKKRKRKPKTASDPAEVDSNLDAEVNQEGETESQTASSSNKGHKKPKAPRKSKAKKTEESKPQAELSNVQESAAKKGKKKTIASPPPVDADFEATLKRLEASLEGPEENRVRNLLG